MWGVKKGKSVKSVSEIFGAQRLSSSVCLSLPECYSYRADWLVINIALTGVACLVQGLADWPK